MCQRGVSVTFNGRYMMKPEDKLKQKFGQDPGFRVPDGYFDDVFAKISASLPEREVAKPAPMTRWQRIKPYVYLAAMFAGIWCMMKMFYMMTSMPDVSLDNPPAMVAEAMSRPEVMDEVISVESVSEEELVAEVAASYESWEEFEADFDYELEQEYAEIDLSELSASLGMDVGDEEAWADESESI